jgi:DNA-binding HxlR family transcriptional regulator
MRTYLRSLVKAGVVEKRRWGGFPGTVDYRLTPAGRDLLGVAEAFAAWLSTSPQGPRDLGTAAAKRATKALIDGWATGMVWALASRPRSLTELDNAIAQFSYPALERRLSSMRRFGLVRPLPSDGRSTPFELSDWLRIATAPLDAAARWERKWSVRTGAEDGDGEASLEKSALEPRVP